MLLNGNLRPAQSGSKGLSGRAACFPLLFSSLPLFSLVNLACDCDSINLSPLPKCMIIHQIIPGYSGFWRVSRSNRVSLFLISKTLKEKEKKMTDWLTPCVIKITASSLFTHPSSPPGHVSRRYLPFPWYSGATAYRSVSSHVSSQASRYQCKSSLVTPLQLLYNQFSGCMHFVIVVLYFLGFWLRETWGLQAWFPHFLLLGRSGALET
jgi:hypothetical protein